MTNIYYTPPSDECFENLRMSAIALWKTMGDEPSYAEEKVGRIKDITNVGDNFMYMFAMFDMGNQKKLAFTLKDRTIDAINERLIAGGSPEYLLL